MILLDTDILVDVLRRYKPALVWLETIEDEIALPGFAAMELVRGCKNKSEQDAVEKTLNRVRILWLSEKGCSKAYEQFVKLHLWSEISMFDVLIAHIALDNKLQLHTFNTKHYRNYSACFSIKPFSQ